MDIEALLARRRAWQQQGITRLRFILQRDYDIFQTFDEDHALTGNPSRHVTLWRGGAPVPYALRPEDVSLLRACIAQIKRYTHHVAAKPDDGNAYSHATVSLDMNLDRLDLLGECRYFAALPEPCKQDAAIEGDAPCVVHKKPLPQQSLLSLLEHDHAHRFERWLHLARAPGQLHHHLPADWAAPVAFNQIDGPESALAYLQQHPVTADGLDQVLAEGHKVPDHNAWQRLVLDGLSIDVPRLRAAQAATLVEWGYTGVALNAGAQLSGTLIDRIFLHGINEAGSANLYRHTDPIYDHQLKTLRQCFDWQVQIHQWLRHHLERLADAIIQGGGQTRTVAWQQRSLNVYRQLVERAFDTVESSDILLPYKKMESVQVLKAICDLPNQLEERLLRSQLQARTLEQTTSARDVEMDISVL